MKPGSRGVDLLFWLGFSMLAAHELDAVPAFEWRLLPFLKLLSDDAAYIVFVLGHVPLVAVLIWLASSPNLRVRGLSRLVIAGFLVVHAGLHTALSGHPDYHFHSWLSRLLIYGGAVLGLAYLIISEVRPRLSKA